MTTPRVRLIASGVAAFLVLVWSSNYSLQKALLVELHPQGMLLARYLITPACAVALLVWRFGFRWPALPRSEWLPLCALSLLGHVMHVSVVMHAMHLSTPFSSALISALGPVFTLMLMRAVSQDRLDRAQVVGVVLALAGVLVFLSDKLLARSASQTLGDVLLLASAALFSAHTVAARTIVESRGALVFLAYSTLLASIPILMMNAKAFTAIDWSSQPVSIWIGLFWSLGIASFGGWLAWAWLNSALGVCRTAPLLYLLPPAAGIIAWATVGESFSATKVLGALLALAGVAVVQFRTRPFSLVK